ncbi:MFS transporter [Streptomyces sp. NPDC060194]|uniref:MFS transporter n=1 Tax=Streptomyces sp. NPDC060194 TaxID=3347069 RepID=UPI003652DC27
MITENHRRLTLAGSVVGASVVAVDGTMLTMVQPELRRELGATFGEVQWTSTGYLIAVAALLVFAGRLGDRHGHRRLFGWGMLGFALTSAGIGLADGIGEVVALRIAQGGCGALLQPATLGMLRAAFPPERLGMPIALRTGVIAASAAVGPLVGGAVAAQFGWRSVFFLNVPLAAAVALVALCVRVPEPRPAGLVPPDLPGAVLLAVALAGLVHTAVALPDGGWTAGTVLVALAATASAVAFARHERRADEPLIPLDVLRSTDVTSSLGLLVAASAALFGSLFLGTYHLQDVLGLDPLATGLHAVSGPALMLAAAPLTPALSRRFGPRATAVGGSALVTAGVLLLARLDAGTAPIALGFALLGAGFGTVMVTATAVLLRAADVSAAGVSGGLQQTALNIGPVLGIAVATMLTTASEGPFASALRPALAALAAVAVAGGLLASRMPGRASARAARPSAPLAEGRR